MNRNVLLSWANSGGVAPEVVNSPLDFIGRLAGRSYRVAGTALRNLGWFDDRGA
jgi:hypothetical protein